jgi:ankyrin repeat protein
MPTISFLHRIEQGRTDLVEQLLSSPDGETVVRECGEKLLAWCSYFGDVTACRLLVGRGASLASLGPDMGLNAAAFHGHWQLAEFLIESGAQVRHADAETGETALHSALTNEDRQRYDLVVQVLLLAGADVNAATFPDVETGSFMRDCRTRGETPLHRAAVFGTADTIALLLAAGADRERRDARGETPLAWASWARRPAEVLRPLLYGAHQIRDGYRPMRANLLGKPVTE